MSHAAIAAKANFTSKTDKYMYMYMYKHTEHVEA